MAKPKLRDARVARIHQAIEAAPEPSPRARRRRALIVLGMHRSGTSALTRVLSLSGAELPSHILPAADGLPNDGNTKAGFWESKSLMELHEEALASAGSKWDDLSDIPSSWFQSEIAEVFSNRLVETLETEFGGAPVIVAKDPRISRLAPVWNVALREMGVEANWLIAVRNPLEVAASLNRRDAFSQSKGLLLWLTYFLAAERNTRRQERMFVLYDHLLEDWRAVIRRIGDQFGLSFSRRSFRAGAEIDDFLDPGLRSHAISPNDVGVREDVAKWVKDAFRWASRAAIGKPGDSEQLDSIKRALRQAEGVYGPLLANAEQSIQRRQDHESELTKEVEKLERAAGDYEKRIAESSGELLSLRAELTDREEAVAQANNEIEEVRRVAVERQAEAGLAHDQLQAEIAQRDESLAGAGTEIEELRRVVGERQEEAARVHAEIAQRDESLAGAGAEIEELRRAVGERQEEAARAHAEIAQRDESLAGAGAEIEELRRVVEESQEEAARTHDQLQAEIAQRDEGLADANTELEELRQFAQQQQAEILMRKTINKEAIARLESEIELSLELAVEREDQLRAELEELAEERLASREQVEVNRSAAAETVPSSGSDPSRVKALAFFLPQYHPIPENDEWWGKGFTEWANVAKAKSCFRDHHQPLLPSELGFYDLRVPEVRVAQAELAREYGIHGFCYYYYWFHGKKLLERPLEDMLASGAPDFPFCLCWANENWTRRWDGQDNEILCAQEHSPESDACFIDDVLPALLDPRYIKRNGEPLLLVYRPDLLADPLETTAIWRETARRAGLPGLHLCAVWRDEDPRPIGFDALVEFPPHHFLRKTITEQVEGRVGGFEGEIYDYQAGVEAIEPLIDQPFPVYRGTMPAWDNTARIGKKAKIFIGTPECYGKWLEQVVKETGERPDEDDQFVFINAWNEWAEGAVLEPSQTHGRAYLEATRLALQTAADLTKEMTPAEQRLDDRVRELDATMDGTLRDFKSNLLGQQSSMEYLCDLGQEHQAGLSWLRDRDTELEATLDEHQTGLAWLRNRDTELAGRLRDRDMEMAATLEEHQAELGLLRSNYQRLATKLEAHHYDLGDLRDVSTKHTVRLEELRRLAVARQARSRSRSLWLNRHFGVAALVLKWPLWLLSGRLRSRLSWWRQARQIYLSGLFDPDDYQRLHPAVEASGIDPLYHYVRFGVAEGLDPSPTFNSRGYLARYPELAESGSNPLLHYLTRGGGWGGADEEADADRGVCDETTISGIAAISENPPEPSFEPATETVNPASLDNSDSREVRWTLNPDQLTKSGAATTSMLFVSHDAARAGAQIYLLEVLKSFSQLPEVELYLMMRAGGELRDDFESYAHVLDLQEYRASGDSEESVVIDAVRAIGEPPAVALCNTVASGAVAKILNGLDVPVVSIVHELPTTIDSLGEETIRDTLASSNSVIVVSEFVKNALVERYSIPADRLKVIYVGVTGWQPESEFRDAARRRVFERHGFADDAVLVLGCGSIHHRKGTDLFAQVARHAILDHGIDRTYFLWVGGDQQGPLFRSWCEHDIATFGLVDRVLFAGQQESAVDYYLAADVFLLTSREDPFPLVNLEALARGLPIVAFRDAGGAQEALTDDAGIVVPYLDTAEMTRAVVRLVEAPRYRAAISEKALFRANERYRWDRFIGELYELLTRHVVRPERLPRG